MLREVYVARISSDERAERARAVMERVRAYSAAVVDRLGSASPADLALLLETAVDSHAQAELAAKVEGIRLLPLDRQIVREADLEYNRFPQILALLALA